MDLPFDGAISEFFETLAPAEVREAIRHAEKGDLLTPSYPHDRKLGRKEYEKQMRRLQIELAKLQAWVQGSGTRMIAVFEGRDAAGKGGTIKRFCENMNPRVARVVALSKPTEAERSQWYFQRYVDHLPSAGEITFFDRSWYNRGVVEQVFGFCTEAQRDRFFNQVTPFEEALVEDGILLFKFWLNVGRAEQLSRFLDRESDPLKQWKLSRIDVDGLGRWDAYSAAIRETLLTTDTPRTPWTVIRSDDKRRARLEAIRHLLLAVDYDRRDLDAIGRPDPEICGGLDVWDA